MIDLIHGDYITEMKKLSDNSIDMICTDMPYGKFGYNTNIKNKKNDKKDLLEEFLEESHRIMKDNTSIYCSKRIK